mgnify:CR=1 FL=1
MYTDIDICEYLEHRFEEEVLVDIRDTHTWQCGSIPGAIHIPIDEIRKLYSLPRDKKICVFCQAGEVSGQYVQLLDDAGYDAYNLTGGFRKYLREHVGEKTETAEV